MIRNYKKTLYILLVNRQCCDIRDRLVMLSLPIAQGSDEDLIFHVSYACMHTSIFRVLRMCSKQNACVVTSQH